MLQVTPLGYFDYPCQDELICKVEIEDVPYFNAPIFLENKEQVGKIDEIFGNVRDYYVSIKPSDNVKASSFKKNQKVGSSFSVSPDAEKEKFCCNLVSVPRHFKFKIRDG